MLSEARETRDWDIHVICPESARRLWREAVKGDASCHFLPDFNQRQDWESDKDQVAEIDAFIGECERASGVSASRAILTGERDLGRGFSRPFYNWFHNRMARAVLADNTEPFRIVRRMFAFARSVLTAARPDLVVSGEWADPFCLITYLVARKMGIDCVVNRPSKLCSGRCYWSEDLYWYNLSARGLTAEKRARQAPVSTRASERIEAFRSKPTTLAYVRQNWDADERRDWLRAHKDLARTFAVQLRHALARRGDAPPKPALRMALEHYRRPWLKWRQKGFFRRYTPDELRDMPYVFFAMHKDPEQALNGQAPFWANQYNTAALLSGALPAGYRLLVREHRRNSGRRPTRYYKDLSRLPGVVLIDGFDDQFKYISNADLIVTENGTTGWEGLLLGRRVMTLADSYYQAAELGHRVRGPEQIATDIVEMLQKPPVENPAAHDQALGWMLDAEWETSVPLEDYTASLDLLGGLISTSARARAESPLEPA